MDSTLLRSLAGQGGSPPVRLYVHMWTKCIHSAAGLILRHSCTSEFWRPQPSSSCWYRSTHPLSQVGRTRSHSQIPMLSPLVTPRVSHTPAHRPWSQATSLAHQLVSLIFSGAHTLTRTPTLAPVTAPGTQGPYARLSDPRCCTHSPVLARAHRTESPSPEQSRGGISQGDRTDCTGQAGHGQASIDQPMVGMWRAVFSPFSIFPTFVPP